MVPGLVLASALLGSSLAGAARVPVAFALSVGIFGLAALPELVLNKSIAFYPIICGSILLSSLGFAVVRIARGRTQEGEHSAIGLSTTLLWVPFSLLAGNQKAADEQFERAVRLEPLSATLQADIGGANQTTGRPEEALWYYEKALELEPNSQLYALYLGRTHALLSTRNGYDEEHFEEAEALLKRVEELGHRPWEEDQREAAWIALGDLYLRWDRPEEAAAAYERALELNPHSEKAKEKLDGLRQEEER